MPLAEHDALGVACAVEHLGADIATYLECQCQSFVLDAAHASVAVNHAADTEIDHGDQR